ncbi:MAG: ribosome maturation factor RimM [Gammaproteobacteria bacterium SG8_15]|nr:MAG: ribosome maturation factor RimM [Gammaproteobacteria bacterium SG8_15]
MDDQTHQLIVVGQVSSAFGVKGWVKINSFTDPVTNILQFNPWYLRARQPEQSWKIVKVLNGRAHGKQVVVQLDGVNDRNQAELMRGIEIAIKRDQLPATEDNEFYWIDLEGLKVVNQEGIDLGVVESLMETGANDVLVVRGDKERLIPFVMDEYVLDVDLDKGTITVDWDPEF